MAILGLFGPPNVHKLEAKFDVTGLIKALTYEKDIRVRLLAAQGLGRIGDDRAVQPLIAALKDNDYVVCNAAGRALTTINVNWSRSEAASAAVPMLIAGMKDSYSYANDVRHDGYDVERKDSATGVRRVAVETLGKIGDARAVESLIAALQDFEGDIRYFAAEALGMIGDTRAVEPLIGSLLDSDYLVCKAAFRVLDEIDPSWSKSKGARAAVPGFIAALNDSDSYDCVRWAAAEALDKIGVPRAVKPESNH